ncbi:hypothetical protein EJ02DRAFT_352564, partial [Clathrospora elynae]
NITWIVSLCISKIAIVAMLLRTTQTVSHRRAQFGVGALIVAQCFVSIILLTANCSLNHEFSWNMDSVSSECPKKEMRWQVSTALDVTTEVFLLFLPVQLVWSLQMQVRNKLIVIFAFWLRLPTIIFSLLRLNATHKLTTASDVSLTAAIVVIWQAVELSYSLAAATIAALKQFTESLNTGFGHGELMRVHGNSQTYKMSDGSAASKNTKASRVGSKKVKTSDISIDSISPESSRAGSRLEARVTRMRLRPEDLRNTAVVSSRPKDSAPDSQSVDDASSEINIIRQEVQYSVHYDRVQ